MNKAKRKLLVANVVSFAMYAGTGLIMWSPDLPLIRTASEYSVHFMLLMLTSVIVFMLMQRQRIMFAALICTGAMALWLKNASNADLKLPIVNEEVNIKVAHVNLANIDERILELKDMLINEDVDVISMQELTPDWTATIRQHLGGIYPHTYNNVRIDPYGIAVFSRLPILLRDTLLTDNVPSLSVGVRQGQDTFFLISSYLTPALDNQSLKKASAQLERIAAKVDSISEHVIALGEYNMVYWSKEIRDFIRDTGLKNSRRDISQGNLRVPYDHIFYSKDMECTEFKELITADQKYLGIVGFYQLKTKDTGYQPLSDAN